jgi:hypothetical protein
MNYGAEERRYRDSLPASAAEVVGEDSIVRERTREEQACRAHTAARQRSNLDVHLLRLSVGAIRRHATVDLLGFRALSTR